MLLHALDSVRARARDLLERRPPGVHAAQLPTRDLRVRVKALRGQTRNWIREHDSPNRRTGALGAAAAVVIAGAVAGTAGSVEPELQLERRAMVTELKPGEVAPAAGALPKAPAAAPAEAPAVPAAPAEAAEAPPSEPADPGPAAPVDEMVVTSPFGYRDNPLWPGYPEFHTGTDFGAVTGTPVKSMLGGTVVEAGWHTTGGGGLRVVVDHGDGVETTYNHMNSIEVEVGQAVDAGSLVGTVGSTGNSTGPHLHFEVLRNGNYEDPMAWL